MTLNKIYRGVEGQIREAIDRGDFDNLSTHGKPIDLSAWRKTPEHLRMGYSVLKNAGITPPEVEIKREIDKIRAQLKTTTDKQEKMRLSNRLNSLMVTDSVKMERLRRK